MHDLDEKSGDEALELGTGRLATIPPNIHSEAAFEEWLTSSRADLLADFAKSRWTLMCMELRLSDISSDEWNTARPADIARILGSATTLERLDQSGQVFYLLPERPELPISFAFQTRDGLRGVLQITAFSEKPHRIKIRYKLAESSSPATQAMRGQAPLQRAGR
jgi:hypothetical protein